RIETSEKYESNLKCLALYQRAVQHGNFALI
ncbi:unnamed protein product, partial [Rotaria sp. Silwood1]